MKALVSVLALCFAMVPSVRAQPQLNFDSGGAATEIVPNAGGAIIPDLLDSRTVLPQQRPGSVSYVRPPELLLSEVRPSTTPHLGSSAFPTAKGVFVDSANSAGASPSSTTPPDGNIKSAPEAPTRSTMESREAITIPIRPPSFFMLLGNVVAIALLGYAWRRVWARPASSRNRI